MANGDISAVIDSLEFDTDTGLEPYIVHVSGNVFVVVYVGVDFHGWMVTFTVDPSGIIGDSVIDSFEFDGAVSLTPRILRVSGDTFVIVYDAVGSFTKLATIDVDSSGNIAAAVTDTLSVASAGSSEPRIIPILGDSYAVVHRNGTDGGEVFSVDIDTSGNIGAAAIDSLEFDSVARTPDIINVSGTMFAVVYEGPDRDGFVATFNIAADGTIDNAVTDTLEFDTSQALQMRILNVSGDVYVITYRGVSPNNIAAKTLTINPAGTISAVIDTLAIDSEGSYPAPVLVSGNVYAVVYKGPGDDGFVKTFTISSAGALSAVLDTLEVDDDNLDIYPGIITVPSSTTVCVTYGGPTAAGQFDGFAKTFTVGSLLVPREFAIVQTRMHYTGEDGNEYWVQGTPV